ncbi:unnamed protein product [Didymodactylos carnosus]|uniref:Uncharacterized protein n=1 Tax=Didymodactylos carnosus TaxID=1234261 RepID=A0A8S2ULJ2_9BILA|nr:unnamed protein product [Didymodactylos carnosus]CAF4350727.1 unnamed protein product [Didymodactylos carnosus]
MSGGSLVRNYSRPMFICLQRTRQYSTTVNDFMIKSLLKQIKIYSQQRSIFLTPYLRLPAEGRMGYPSEKYEPNTITAVDKEEDKNIKPFISGLYNDGFQLNNEMRIVGAVFAFPRQFICWNVGIEQK